MKNINLISCLFPDRTERAIYGLRVYIHKCLNVTCTTYFLFQGERGFGEVGSVARDESPLHTELVTFNLFGNDGHDSRSGILNINDAIISESIERTLLMLIKYWLNGLWFDSPVDESTGHFANGPQSRVGMSFYFPDDCDETVDRLWHPLETIADGLVLIANGQFVRDSSGERILSRGHGSHQNYKINIQSDDLDHQAQHIQYIITL